MAPSPSLHLSRRERQIMDIVYRLGQASVSEVMENLPKPPKYSGVRTLLNILEKKGHLTHKSEGARYVYMPTRSKYKASQSALKGLLPMFFDNSVERAVTALLKLDSVEISEDELDRLSALIEEAKQKLK